MGRSHKIDSMIVSISLANLREALSKLYYHPLSSEGPDIGGIIGASTITSYMADDGLRRSFVDLYESAMRERGMHTSQYGFYVAIKRYSEALSAVSIEPRLIELPDIIIGFALFLGVWQPAHDAIRGINFKRAVRKDMGEKFVQAVDFAFLKLTADALRDPEEYSLQGELNRFQSPYDEDEGSSINDLFAYHVFDSGYGDPSSISAQQWGESLKSVFSNRPKGLDGTEATRSLLRDILEKRGWKGTTDLFESIFGWLDFEAAKEDFRFLNEHMQGAFFDSLSLLLENNHFWLAEKFVYYHSKMSRVTKQYPILNALAHASAYWAISGKLNGIQHLLIAYLFKRLDEYYKEMLPRLPVAWHSRELVDDTLRIFDDPAVPAEIEIWAGALLDPNEEQWFDKAASLNEYMEEYLKRILTRGSGSGSDSGALPPESSGSSAPSSGSVASAISQLPQYASTAIAGGVNYVSSLADYSYEYEPITAAEDLIITHAGDEGDQIYAEWNEETEDFGDQDTAADDFAVSGFAAGATEFYQVPMGI